MLNIIDLLHQCNENFILLIMIYSYVQLRTHELIYIF